VTTWLAVVPGLGGRGHPTARGLVATHHWLVKNEELLGMLGAGELDAARDAMRAYLAESETEILGCLDESAPD
jgi:DNA-binding FadR family transcriptional regulator